MYDLSAGRGDELFPDKGIENNQATGAIPLGAR